jgi:hypothetical protein
LPEAVKRRVQAVSLSQDTLVLAVGSAALATKLRQTVPRIEAGLNSRGWKVNLIQIRVQPDVNPIISMGYTKIGKNAVVSGAGRQSLQALESQLEDGPLRNAIARLASR